MSKMNDLSLEIQERLFAGQSPEYIANWLEIPIQWVNDTLDYMLESDEPDPDYVEEL